MQDGQQVGVVTSGTWSPTFEKALGMAYVPVAMAAVGTASRSTCAARSWRPVVVALPFYKRAR